MPAVVLGAPAVVLGSVADGAAVGTDEPIVIAGSDGTNVRRILVTASGAIRVDPTGTTTQPVSVASMPLPTGAATEVTLGTRATEATLALVKAKTDNIDVLLSTRATEATLATRLAEATFTARINTLGQKAMAASTPVAFASDQSALAITAASLPLPTGAATAALQTQPGVDIGDVTVNNAAGASAVNIQDGGNSITVDGTVGISGTVPVSGPLTDAQLRAAAVPISAASLPLPTGAATAALQTQPGVDIGDVTINNAAAGAAVNIQDGGNSITVDASSWPLPTGAATEATVATLLLNSTFNARINTFGQKVMASSTPVVIASDQSTLPISASSLPLPTGAATAALQTQPGVDIGDVTINNAAGASAVNIQDGGNSITVDAASWPLPTGAATSALQTTGNTSLSNIDTKTPSLGQALMAASSPVVIASNQTAIPITDNSGSLTVDGTVTANQGTAAALASAWPVKVTDGTNSMPTGDVVGRAIFHKITDGTNTAAVKAGSTAAVATDQALVVAVSPNNTVATSIAAGGYGGQVEGRAADGAAVVGNPVLIGGFDGTNAQTLLTDSSGRLVTAPAGSTVANGFAYGTVTTSAVTNVPVRATTFVEQASNAQRSIASASANDAAAGTGARTVRLTYYTATFTGPFTEDLTLNGTTGVNTVATNICYVEKIQVLTAGSGGVTAGIVSLYAAVAKGGGAIGTIAAGDNQTFWAHHYVPTGKTAYVTGMTGNNNNSSNQTLFTIWAQDLSVANAAQRQISDSASEGGASSQSVRIFSTAILVPGPARIVLYAQPGGTPSIINRGSFDFYEQ